MRYTSKSFRASRRKRRINAGRFIAFLAVLAAIAVGIAIIVMYFNQSGLFVPSSGPVSTPTPDTQPTSGVQANPTLPATDSQDAAETATPAGESAQTQSTDAINAPIAVAGTMPSFFYFETEVLVDNEEVDSYTPPFSINFSDTADNSLPSGVTTFNGNIFRDAANWGVASVSEKKLSRSWNAAIDQQTLGSNGQPLIVQWENDLRYIMNITDEKKSKENLTEVICPAGEKVFFFDLEDGSQTRNPIELTYPADGAAALDPRGYPLLYVGQSSAAADGESYMSIYSLIDGRLLWWESASVKDSVSQHTDMGFSAAPVISAAADTLVWPGENGVLYIVTLNSQFDSAAGSISVSPDVPVKYRYKSDFQTENQADGAAAEEGIDFSAAAWKNYLFFVDNSGWLQCLDMNTLQPVYVQYLKESPGGSPVLEADGDNLSLYIGSTVSAEPSGDQEQALAYAWKINALTGEIVWEVGYQCYYDADYTGGITVTPVVGKESLSDMVYFTVSRSGQKNGGQLAALRKDTGSVVWDSTLRNYSHSSPVAVYTESGTGYLIQCSSSGEMTLVDAKTGDQLDKTSLGQSITNSPSVFDNIIVTAMQDGKIQGTSIR